MIAEALAAACADPEVLARIGGPLGEDARAAGATLAALPVQERRAKRATWVAAARAPLPPGLRGVDKSWIEAALKALPARATEAVASALGDPVSIWLARWACGEFPAMPAVDPSVVRPRSVDEAVRMSAAALARWLVDVGADQLAYALGDQAAYAAPAFGEVIVRAVRRITLPPRAGELGPRRDAITRARVEAEPFALIRIGARAIAPHVDVLARRQLACRLERPAGLAILRELRAHATMPADRTPSWKALAASVTT